jgi:hypothetical protein
LIIAGLWLWRYGAYFNKSKTQGFQFPQVFCIFIKPGAEAYFIFELKVEQVL